MFLLKSSIRSDAGLHRANLDSNIPQYVMIGGQAKGVRVMLITYYEGLNSPAVWPAADPDLPLGKPHYHSNEDDGNDGE